MRLIDYVHQISSLGRCYFTSEEAEHALKLTRKALNMSLLRLKQKGLLASPAKQFYLIIPPEYASLGCLPPEQFIPHLMKYWKLPYYVCLLSAAEYYGSGHQRSQNFQVMTIRNKPDIQCGQINIRFIKRKNWDEVFVKQFNTPRSIVSVSTPEVTAMDLINYPWQSGGFHHITTVLSELFETINAQEIINLAKKSKQHTWIQRIAYILKTIGDDQLSKKLFKTLKNKKLQYIPLNPYLPKGNCPKDTELKVVINMILESDV